MSAFSKVTQLRPSNTLFTSTLLKYKSDNISIEGLFSNFREFKGTVAYVPSDYKDLTIKTEVKGEFEKEKDFQYLIKSDYNAPNIRVEAKLTNGESVNLAALTGSEKFGAGFEADYNIDKGRLTKYDAGLYYKEGDQQYVLKHESTAKDQYSLGNIMLSAYRSMTKDVIAGGNIRFNPASNDVNFEVAGEYKMSSTQLLKGRFDSEGNVALGGLCQCTPNIGFSSGVQINLKEATNLNAVQFGLKVKINP